MKGGMKKGYGKNAHGKAVSDMARSGGGKSVSGVARKGKGGPRGR